MKGLIFSSLKFKCENAVKTTKFNLKEEELETVTLQIAKRIAEEV